MYQTRVLLSLARISLSALWRISASEGLGSRVEVLVCRVTGAHHGGSVVFWLRFRD